FNLHRADDVVVPVTGVTQQASLVHAALREIDRAGSGRGVSAAGHILPDVVGGIDVGAKDSIGAHVERLLDAGTVRMSTDTHHGYRAAKLNSGEHSRKSLISHRSMLRVDQ